MKYIVQQLGNIERGNVVEVLLKGNAANVLLLVGTISKNKKERENNGKSFKNKRSWRSYFE